MTRFADPDARWRPPKGNARGGKREDLGGLYMRSTMEANFARYLAWLKAHGIIRDWQHEPEEFWFDGIKRGTRSYLPDFRVTENNGAVVYYETKGYMDPVSRTKLRRMAKYHPEVKIVVVGRAEYAEIRKKVGAMVPGWEEAD